jgi:membrane protease YdiL (CAAX protease family)
MKNNLSLLAQRPAAIRIIAFLLCLLVIWLPIAIPIYLLIYDANLMTILAMGMLALSFFIFLPRWGKLYHVRLNTYH